MKLPVRKPWLHVEVDEATPRPLPLRARSPRRGRCLEAARPLRAGLKPTSPPFGPAACWHRRIRGDTSLPKPRQWMLEEPFYMSLPTSRPSRVCSANASLSSTRRFLKLGELFTFSRSSERPLALCAESGLCPLARLCGSGPPCVCAQSVLSSTIDSIDLRFLGAV